MLKGMFHFFRKENKVKNGKYDLARSILGDDFISPEEIQSGYKGFNYCSEVLRYLADTFPSEEVVVWLHNNNYVLIAGPPSPMSILEIRHRYWDLFYTIYQNWYDKREWASSEWREEVKSEWIMIRKGAVPDSTDKPLREQEKLLLKGEHVPSITGVAWSEATYKENRGKWLFGSMEVRTSTLTLLQDHNSPGIQPHMVYGNVVFGWSNRGGIGVTACLDYQKCWDLGLASARKPGSFK